MYVVVRSDMSPGDILCQTTHAAVDWALAFPEKAAEWHEDNYLIVLEVPSEQALLDYADLLMWHDLACLVVHEPDMPESALCNDGQHTALAVEHAGGRYLSELRLALKEPAMS